MRVCNDHFHVGEKGNKIGVLTLIELDFGSKRTILFLINFWGVGGWWYWVGGWVDVQCFDQLVFGGVVEHASGPTQQHN